MKIIFDMTINSEYDIKKLDYYLLENKNAGTQMKYINEILYNLIKHRVRINEIIEEYAIDWSIDRIAKIDLTILQLALVEILFIDEIPYNIAINEGVELAKKYSESSAPAFINGILGKFVQKEGIN